MSMIYMRELKRRVATLKCSPVFFCLAVVASGCATHGSWRSLDQGDFPARVVSITFANGNVVDRTHSVRWGAWSASFGSNLPVAQWDSGRGGSCHQIVIDSVRFENAVTGERQGAFAFADCQSGGWICSFGLGNFTSIDIDCPSSIQFERP
jgi:hypothetical protein